MAYVILLLAVVSQLMVALPFWVFGPLILALVLFQLMDGSYLVGIDCRLAFHFITDLVTKKQNINKKNYVLEFFDEKFRVCKRDLFVKLDFSKLVRCTTHVTTQSHPSTV